MAKAGALKTPENRELKSLEEILDYIDEDTNYTDEALGDYHLTRYRRVHSYEDPDQDWEED